MAVQFRIVSHLPKLQRQDFVVIPVDSSLATDSSLIAAPIVKEIMSVARERSYKGDWGTADIMVAPAAFECAFVGLAGLGPYSADSSRQAEGLRRALGRIVMDARRHSLHHLIFDGSAIVDPALFTAVVEAILLANYRFTEYLPELADEQAARAVRKVTLVVPVSLRSAVTAQVADIEHTLAGVALARDLVNRPAAAVTPASLVYAAREVARRHSSVHLKVLNRAAAEKAKMGAFLAVARGSKEEPYVIDLTYKPAKKARAKVFVVGKGITFDSGGLSLKPAENMELMKSDMAGAASVLGLFAVVPHLQLDIEVHGIIATCENMPSGSAYRPGDVLVSKNGKTIEVLNTDAEGRLTLADALWYSVEQAPTAVIDLATLTGACMVALGETVAGVWSNHDELQQQVLAAGKKSGEGLCPMPLPDEYMAHIKSTVATVRNTSMSRYGGAITAALFLREFVGSTPWVHIDIAGPSFAERPLLPYYDIGATGFGVRTLVEFLKAYAPIE